MYMGFNMLDPVVGGESERARKLRQAISIAIDQEEFISIFLNGRGIAAQGPIPPGIFGYEGGESGIDRYVYDVGGRGAAPQVDRRRQEAAGRSRLPEWASTARAASRSWSTSTAR